jgi:Uma2 family endonuclease
MAMSSRLNLKLTPDEYLAFERRSEERHEYVNGELFAMSGASERHNQIVVNLGREISTQFKGRSCKVYTNGMRVRIEGTTRYSYPDVTALCEAARFENAELDTLTNPSLIIEVLSASTEAYDRGSKFEDYRQIETLVEYVLVAQGKPHIEQFRRQADGQWLFSATSGLESVIDLASVGCRLSLAEIYDKVEFGPEPEPEVRKMNH